MAIPTALERWFSSSYPTLKFDPEWLNACVNYLNEHFPNTPTPSLIKLVETQLLLSDLSTSTLPPTTSFPSPLPATATTLFPGGRAKSVLVQVVEIDEIAHPALGLLETLKNKREERKLGADEVERRRAKAQEEGEEGEVVGKYGRGMSKLQLSDGHCEPVQAIELKKIDLLGLEDCKLGAKILIHDIKLVKKMLLLTPESTTVKGHMVEELEEHGERKLENRFRERLRLPPIGDEAEPEAAPAAQPQPVAQAQPNLRHNPPPPPQPQPSEAPQQAQAGPGPRSKNARKPPSPSPPPEPDSDFFEDGLDAAAEEELARLEAEAFAARTKEKEREKILVDMNEPEEEEDDDGLDGLDFEMAPPEVEVEVGVETRGKGKGKEKERVEMDVELEKDDDEVIKKESVPAVVPKKRVEVLSLDDTDDEDEEEPKPVIQKKNKETKVIKKTKLASTKVGGGEVIIID